MSRAPPVNSCSRLDRRVRIAVGDRTFTRAAAHPDARKPRRPRPHFLESVENLAWPRSHAAQTAPLPAIVPAPPPLMSSAPAAPAAAPGIHFLHKRAAPTGS